MDDLQKIKEYVKNADKDRIYDVMHHDPCFGCAKLKYCKYIESGRLCKEVAKEILDHEVQRMENPE